MVLKEEIQHIEIPNVDTEKQQLNENLKLISENLNKENTEIVKDDINELIIESYEKEKEAILEGIQQQLNIFVKKLVEPETKKRIIANTLSTLTVVSMTLGCAPGEGNDKYTKEKIIDHLNKPQVAQVEEAPTANMGGGFISKTKFGTSNTISR